MRLSDLTKKEKTNLERALSSWLERFSLEGLIERIDILVKDAEYCDEICAEMEAADWG